MEAIRMHHRAKTATGILALGAIAVLIVVCAWYLGLIDGNSDIEVIHRKPDGELIIPGDRYYSRLVFSPDGKQLVAFGWEIDTTAGFPMMVGIWDMQNRTLSQFVVNCKSDVHAPVISADGKMLSLIGEDGRICMFSYPGFQLLGKLDQSFVRHLESLTDGKRMLTAKTFGDVRLWQLDRRQFTSLNTPHEKKSANEMLNQLAASRDGRRIAVQYTLQTEIWDADTLGFLGHLPANGDIFLGVALDADGRWIATSQSGERVTIWNGATHKIHKHLRGASTGTSNLRFSKDGRLLVCCTRGESSTDGTEIPSKICIWAVESGQLLYAFYPGGTLLAVSPDDRWLVTTGPDHRFRLWDFEKIRFELGY